MAKVKVLVDRDNWFDSEDDDHDSLNDEDSDDDDDASHGSDNKDDHVAEEEQESDDVDDDNEESHVTPMPAENQDPDGPSDSSSDIDETTETSQTQDNEKSGMASVIARILSKDISKSKRVLLAKGKTSQEIFRDISERKRQREESGNANVKSKLPKKEKLQDVAREEKRKIWESMGRRIPSVLDNPREVRLRKIATQGMVQLFRLVSQAKMQG